MASREDQGWVSAPSGLLDVSGAHYKHVMKRTLPSEGQKGWGLGRGGQDEGEEPMNDREISRLKPRAWGWTVIKTQKWQMKMIISLGVLHSNVAFCIFKSTFTCIISFFPNNKLRRRQGNYFYSHSRII